MPTASTRLNIKSKFTQPSSRSDNNKVLGNKKKNYTYSKKVVVKTSATFTSFQKFEHDNQQISINHPSRKCNNKNCNNSRSTKIRYNKKTGDDSTSTSADTYASNASSKVLTTNETFWNENCEDCIAMHNYVESSTSSTSYYSPQYHRCPSNISYSSTSTQSSRGGDQELYNTCNNGSRHTNNVSSTKENVKKAISQYWVTSLYDIYSVTQKFNPLENMHQNYLDTVRYTILAIWDTSYDSGLDTSYNSGFHCWMQQVLQTSGTNCRIIELALYYLLRFKRCLNNSKVGLSYIFNCSRFTVSTEPCPESQESTKPLPAFVSSLIVAWKFFQDENYKTNHWTSFTGYTIEQLNVFERDFLRMIDYNVFIKESSFKQWLRFLHSHMQAICGPGLDVKSAYFLPQNQERINEFIKSLKMLNIEEMERIIRVNERYIGRDREQKAQTLNLEDIKRFMRKS